jgi:hypothetical protein
MNDTKTLFGIRWKHLGQSYWQSEAIDNKIYFMIDNLPLAYQDFHTCDHTISSIWLTTHTTNKIGLAKWIGLATNEIREMIKTNQYKIKPHNEFIQELLDIVGNRKGVK